jgi:glutathione S-transferase
MLTVWGRATSSNVQKVMWAVGELDLPHQRIDAGGPYGGLDTPEFAAMNPNRAIPTIDDDGIIVWESNAIVSYLSTRYGIGTLYPDDWPRRAAAHQWMDWMQATFYRDWIDLFWGLVRTAPSKRDAAALAGMAERCGERLQRLDAHLADHPYVTGASLTMGDIPIGSTLYRYFDMETERPSLPNVEAYYARLRDRPAYQAHVMVSYESLRVTDEGVF